MLEVRNLAKHFGGVQALRGVSLHVDGGEVLGLVGDNGAGKSTLLKILSGALRPSSGEIEVDGRPVTFTDPHAAREHGVATVYQDLALAAQRDVVANFFLGREITRRFAWLGMHWLDLGWLDNKAMTEHTVKELARLGTRIPDVHAMARDLSGGQRQALAIARAAAWSSSILLLELIRRVRGEGIAVLLISHQMPDILAVCDRAVVLRLGQVAATLEAGDLTSENLVGYITGAGGYRCPS
jgi:simple sugar transport system ATP-binding protein